MQKTRKALGILLLVAGATTYAMANPIAVPEIGSSASSAVAVVSGIVLMIRTRKNKKK